MGVHSTVLGTFTDTGKFHARYEGKTVAYLDMDFLHNGLPRMHLRGHVGEKNHRRGAACRARGLHGLLLAILGRWNVCSKEYVVRQYDHEVQAGTVVKPLSGRENDGPTDAAVVRPVLRAWKASW